MNWLWHDVEDLARVQIPDRIPVFPLPNALLFPFIQIPLHIFEPRYRTMLADCLNGDRFLAISLIKSGWEEQAEPIPCHDIVGVGFVRFAQKNEDGTSSMVLAGITRAHIDSYVKTEPYRIARISPVGNKIGNKIRIGQKNQKLYDLFLNQLRCKTGELDSEARINLEKLKVADKFANIAAYYAEISLEEKQSLLEELDLEVRLDRLITIYNRMQEES